MSTWLTIAGAIVLAALILLALMVLGLARAKRDASDDEDENR